MKTKIRVNNTTHELSVDARVTLLDTLRDELGLTGTKKGCDQGACGACTSRVLQPAHQFASRDRSKNRGHKPRGHLNIWKQRD